MKTLEELKQEGLKYLTAITVDSSDRENLALKLYSLDDCKIKDKTERLIHYEVEQGNVYEHLNTEWRFYKSSNDIGWRFINIGLFEVVPHEDKINQTVTIQIQNHEDYDTHLTLEQWNKLSRRCQSDILQQAILQQVSAYAYIGDEYLSCY